MQCVVLSCPFFSRDAKTAFRQIGIMHILPELSSPVSVSWVGGKNDVGTIVVLSSNSNHSFQTTLEPDTKDICVVSPSPCYDFQFFSEHPYYLP